MQCQYRDDHGKSYLPCPNDATNKLVILRRVFTCVLYMCDQHTAITQRLEDVRETTKIQSP